MRMTIIERAYELARGGTCRTVSDIGATLKREHFSSVDAHLQGGSIRKSLAAVLNARQAEAQAAAIPAE